MTNETSPLTRLFQPRSIAVIGASASPSKIGSVPIAHLIRYGYDGDIYPINPKAEKVQGLQAYPTMASIETPVDMAIVAVPQALAGAAIEEAAMAGAGSAVVFTSGYAEVGEAGKQAQQRLSRLAHDYGMPILGPNCLGFMNVRAKLYATFSPAPLAGLVGAGHVGMVTQSGAFGGYAYSLARERGLGLSYWMSTGNQCNVDVADCIEWLADDPHTRVIMVYLEGCNDGARFQRALMRARAADKPVVVTKVGRTGSGAAAAASHTASLAGDDAVYDALFRQCGAIRALNIEDFFNFGYALSVLPRRPAGRRLGILTLSGGVGALMADDAEQANLELPVMPDLAQQALVQRVPFAGPRNPVDITGQATSEPDLLNLACKLMGNSGSYDSLIVFLAATGSSQALWKSFSESLLQTRRRHPEMAMAVCTLLPSVERRVMDEAGIPVFVDPTAAIRTLGAITASQPCDAILPASPATDARLQATLRQDGAFSEARALDLLGAAGISVVSYAECANSEQAVQAFKRFGAPVAIKLSSPDVAHKSDIGGVKLNVHSEEEVRKAFDAITAAARQRCPGARMEGVLVAPMVADGVECIIGVHRDPTFGPVVMVGLGGVLVEVLRDVSFRLAPFDVRTAHDMINSLKGANILFGARGQAPCDVDALADALVKLSHFAAAAGPALASAEINPLLVRSAGRGAIAVDAVIAATQK